jgi:uncharacterized membrane protein YgdD (TMEM256/DUF423 family)
LTVEAAGASRPADASAALRSDALRHVAAGRRTARRCVLAAGFFGFSGVAAGAFGAHALRAQLPPDALAVFETASRYQLLHALALLGCGWVARESPGRTATAALVLFSAGIALFSGSLYALSLTGIRGFGALTPIGGVLLLLAWLALAATAARGKD